MLLRVTLWGPPSRKLAHFLLLCCSTNIELGVVYVFDCIMECSLIAEPNPCVQMFQPPSAYSIFSFTNDLLMHRVYIKNRNTDKRMMFDALVY